jgi:hypothetical protein
VEVNASGKRSSLFHMATITTEKSFIVQASAFQFDILGSETSMEREPTS